MPEPERDLVVGADGFLGCNLVPRLQAEGREVVGIGRAAGDLADWATVERLFRAAPPVARIFHVVTRQRTGAVQYDIQGELLAINARIHLNVLEAWRLFQPQAKLISTGSSCTYPESAEPLPEARFGQGPTHPSVVGYGLAKQVLATGSAAYAHQYGLHFLHCVLATLYGPHDNKAADRSHFVGALLDRAVREKAAGAESFEVWGDPRTVREVLHVDDQIDAILAADRVFDNAILNCAANTPVTVEAVAQAALAALDWSVPLVSPPGSFQGAAYKMLDSTRFLDGTGWRPRIGLEAGLRSLVAAEYAA
ncbi:GDP-L-fucose synthase [Methylobacterium phyllostachyos]|uniref:GDP-L-fucose synthase n=1 Tax=Methylobacterium phyllostachyos TaxID=582672 RepID=A0A1H0DQZ2_9HYPH|nr:NAD-dependent epimerase/dehydratase family protein [Methylobacterium phyllostachyos]SDN72469.1 GDP-L-fucose synthase [Methylobacterium phyllostachyos]